MVLRSQVSFRLVEPTARREIRGQKLDFRSICEIRVIRGQIRNRKSEISDQK